MEKTKLQTKNSFWVPPYEYSHSIILLFALMLVSTILQLTIGFLPPVTWPLNFIFLLIYIAGLIVFYIVACKTELFKWLAGIPLALATLYTLAMIGLIAGFVPQDQALIGIKSARIFGVDLSWFYQIIRSWHFIIIFLLLLTNLGLAIINKLCSQPIKNSPFLLNHFGIWLIFIASFFGSDDLQRVKLILPEGHISSQVYDADGNRDNLPFAIKLNKFILEEYSPALDIFDFNTGSRLLKKGHPILEIEKLNNNSTKIKQWQVEVKKYIKYARQTKNGFVKTTNKLGSPAAYIRITDTSKKNSTEGWISREGPMSMEKVLNVNDAVFVISKIRAKRFASHIDIYKPSNKVISKVLEVNKTFTVDGWTLYQSSYEKRIPGYGLWISVIEAVRDPWLPVVNVGFYIVIFSAIFILIKGVPKKSLFQNNKQNEELSK